MKGKRCIVVVIEGVKSVEGMGVESVDYVVLC